MWETSKKNYSGWICQRGKKKNLFANKLVKDVTSRKNLEVTEILERRSSQRKTEMLIELQVRRDGR